MADESCANPDKRLLRAAEDLVRDGDVRAGFVIARDAAWHGEEGAWTFLGNLYAEGKGTARSSKDAAQCYARAEAAGEVKGAGLRGMCLITGKGVKQDMVCGVEMLMEAARAGDLTAMKNCAWVYRHGERYMIARDDDAADTWKAAVYAVRKARAEGNFDLASVPEFCTALRLTEDSESSGSDSAKNEEKLDSRVEKSDGFLSPEESSKSHASLSEKSESMEPRSVNLSEEDGLPDTSTAEQPSESSSSNNAHSALQSFSTSKQGVPVIFGTGVEASHSNELPRPMSADRVEVTSSPSRTTANLSTGDFGGVESCQTPMETDPHNPTGFTTGPSGSGYSKPRIVPQDSSLRGRDENTSPSDDMSVSNGGSNMENGKLQVWQSASVQDSPLPRTQSPESNVPPSRATVGINSASHDADFSSHPQDSATTASLAERKESLEKAYPHIQPFQSGMKDEVHLSAGPRDMPGLPRSPPISPKSYRGSKTIPPVPQAVTREDDLVYGHRSSHSNAIGKPPSHSAGGSLVEVALTSDARMESIVQIDDNPTYYQDQLSSFDRFLINCDVRHVGIPLGFTAFSAMWRAMFLNITNSASAVFQASEGVRLPVFAPFWKYAFQTAWYNLWIFTSLLYSIFITLYIVRSKRYPYLLVEEFQDAVLTNFFAAIAIVAGVLTVIVPPPFANYYVVRGIFAFLLVYKAVLSVGFWYKDWLFSVGSNTLRRTSPIYFMAVINFFILATVSAQVGAVELAIFLFMLGSLFWLVVFVASFSFLAKTYDTNVDKPSPTLFCFLAPPAAAGIGWITISKARGMDPLNDITRFYAAVLIFLLLLLARLTDLFCSLEFNVGWWAYVFPLGSAATMTILLAGVFGDNIWIVSIAYSAFFATTALMILVASLTVIAISQGKIPQSPVAMATYERQCRYAETRVPDEGAISRIRAGIQGFTRNLSSQFSSSSASASRTSLAQTSIRPHPAAEASQERQKASPESSSQTPTTQEPASYTKVPYAPSRHVPLPQPPPSNPSTRRPPTARQAAKDASASSGVAPRASPSQSDREQAPKPPPNAPRQPALRPPPQRAPAPRAQPQRLLPSRAPSPSPFVQRPPFRRSGPPYVSSQRSQSPPDHVTETTPLRVDSGENAGGFSLGGVADFCKSLFTPPAALQAVLERQASYQRPMQRPEPPSPPKTFMERQSAYLSAGRSRR